MCSPAPAVDVDGRTHSSPDHGTALYVPPRPARTPGAVPLGLPLLGSFPKDKVSCVPLLRVNSNPLAGPVVFLLAHHPLAPMSHAVDQACVFPLRQAASFSVLSGPDTARLLFHGGTIPKHQTDSLKSLDCAY